MPSLKFPYMNYEDIGVPVIPFEVKGDKWHEIWGFVDWCDLKGLFIPRV